MKDHGEKPALIAEGVRELWFNNWEIKFSFGRPKLALYFDVPAVGKEQWVRLARHYNVELVGTPSPQVSFNAGWKSDYLREFATYFDIRTEDYRNPARFGDISAWGEIKTVTHDSKRRPIPQALWYSTIARLVPPPET